MSVFLSCYINTLLFNQHRNNCKVLLNLPVVESDLSSAHIRLHSLPIINIVYISLLFYLMCTVIISVHPAAVLHTITCTVFYVAPHCNAAFEHTEVLHHHSFFLHIDVVAHHDVYSDSCVNSEPSIKHSKEYLL